MHASESRALTALQDLFQAGRPLIYICSPEEKRAQRLLEAVAKKVFTPPIPVWTWSRTEGMTAQDGSRADLPPGDSRAVLEFIAAHESAGIFQLKDFHDFLFKDPEILRRMRDLYDACLDKRKFIAVTSPLRTVPAELGSQMAILDLPVPDLD